MSVPSPPDPQSSQAENEAPAESPSPPPRPDRVRFADLAGDAVEVEVEYAGQIYRLRRTRQGKLLLTK